MYSSILQGGSGQNQELMEGVANVLLMCSNTLRALEGQNQELIRAAWIW
jgi:hypothetical protein